MVCSIYSHYISLYQSSPLPVGFGTSDCNIIYLSMTRRCGLISIPAVWISDKSIVPPLVQQGSSPAGAYRGFRWRFRLGKRMIFPVLVEIAGTVPTFHGTSMGVARRTPNVSNIRSKKSINNGGWRAVLLWPSVRDRMGAFIRRTILLATGNRKFRLS